MVRKPTIGLLLCWVYWGSGTLHIGHRHHSAVPPHSFQGPLLHQFVEVRIGHSLIAPQIFELTELDYPIKFALEIIRPQKSSNYPGFQINWVRMVEVLLCYFGRQYIGFWQLWMNTSHSVHSIVAVITRCAVQKENKCTAQIDLAFMVASI